MESNEDKKLDQLIRKSIRLRSFDAAPEDFEELILQKIQAVKMKDKEPYKPLISAFGWTVIGLGFLALITYLVIISYGQPSIWLKGIDYTGSFQNKFLKDFDVLKFSSAVFYSVVCFFIVLAVQLPFLKQHFDKQLNY
jgi:uncharacterized membrane protein YbhN (UPF0104 family)